MVAHPAAGSASFHKTGEFMAHRHLLCPPCLDKMPFKGEFAVKLIPLRGATFTSGSSSFVLGRADGAVVRILGELCQEKVHVLPQLSWKPRWIALPWLPSGMKLISRNCHSERWKSCGFGSKLASCGGAGPAGQHWGCWGAPGSLQLIPFPTWPRDLE